MDNRNNLLIFILALGVLGILNTELGVVGILPLIAEHFHVSISQAGLLVSLFALAVAISGPILPLLFSVINRKKVMLLVLGIFVLGEVNITEGKNQGLNEDIILRFIAGAYVEIVEWWFANGMPFPSQVMAEQVGILIERIA